MRMKALAATALALSLTAGASRAEPGTPSRIEARAWPGTVAGKPAIDLTFKGWKEKARFFVAITRNGQPWAFTREQVGYSDRCGNRFPLAFGDHYTCIYPADPTKSPAQNWSDKPGTDGYAMHFRNLEWGSEYCFRLMAQDDEGEYAKLWTGWACDRTNAAPPLPAAPSNVKVTGVPPTSGSGVVGNGTPSRILIEWAPGSDTAKFVVEKALLVPNPRFEPVAPRWDERSTPTNSELVLNHALDLEQPVQFRVCGENVMGRTCSPGKRFPPRDLKENAVAVDLPRHGPAPMTSTQAVQKGPSVVPTPVPLTATAAALSTPQALAPKVGAAPAPPLRVRDWKQAPSAFGR